jgi:hypothetical protein
MTNEQINIAIAEACGWEKEFNEDYINPEFHWIPPYDKYDYADIPNYCNDLNAMHEAESSLNSNQVQDYTLNLLRVTNNDGSKFYGTLGCFVHVHATARQRAEAFLKTIGKWEE